VPETGRIFFQTLTAPLHNLVRVNFQNASRSPLLLIGGEVDKVCPAAQIRSNYRKYQHSPAVTDYKEFPGRAHWIIAQDGWEEVAGAIVDWIGQRVQ
jgi:dipeptidyl aminopeptidase/acylaminoacyl peptidase